ncbi:MAG: sensor histidine kinase [Firmicutes bacterium]|nr:sensor histidine kinase [Bacillota bacterium]
MPIELLVSLVERLGLLVGLAFLATQSGSFRHLVWRQVRRREQLLLALVFGAFGILGTYTGVRVRPDGADWDILVTGPLAHEDAIANSRAVSVIIAGLLGGPITGLGAGLVAAIHRYSVGGFTALPCALATALEGLVSGLLHRRLEAGSNRLSPRVGLGLTALLELVQMVLILLLARPTPAAVALVRRIAVPMIAANSAGVAFFILLIQSIFSKEAEREGDAARKALTIATRTLPYLRRGLNYESAMAAATVIHEVTGVAAVALTDTERILAHVGVGADHHLPGRPLRTSATRQAIQENRMVVAEGQAEIACDEPGCPLQGAVVVPLHENQRIVGTLKLYYDPTRSRAPVELAQGLAYHFSTQLALARAEEQAALLAKAEIRALQAQIQPHFLFNALNTVMALIRRDPEQARDVLGHLGDFIRRNLQTTQCETVTLGQELEHVRDYLAVEQARHGQRLTVTYDVSPGVLTARIPPLTLQPLVENAIVHGLKAVRRDGRIHIAANRQDDTVVITVADNGRGIEPERLQGLLERPASSQGGNGLALYNVHQRLQGLFGPRAGLRIASAPGSGTTVTVILPLETSAEEDSDADSGSHRR